MSPAEQAVTDIYQNIQQHLSLMVLACRTDAQRATIRVEYTNARRNYYACINKAFHNDDPELANLVTAAESVVEELKDIDKQLGDIQKVIDIITQGVTYGSQIVGKIIAL